MRRSHALLLLALFFPSTASATVVDCELLLDKTCCVVAGDSGCESPPSGDCEAPLAPPTPHCLGAVTEITLVYIGDFLGEGCTVSNPQGGDASCSGVADPGDPVSITLTTPDVTLDADTGVAFGDEVVFSPAGAEIGDVLEFDVSGAGGTQSLRIKTSCDEELNLGDRFGSFVVFGLSTTGGSFELGAEVEYQYAVTNAGATSVTNVEVDDDPLGTIVSGVSLAPGEPQTFTRRATLFGTTTNVAAATGDVPGHSCDPVTDGVTVTVTAPPPPPELVATKVDSLEDDVYGDGNFSPGDTVRYTVEIENLSGSKAKNVQFNDAPDPKAELVVGSVTTTKGTILQGNSAGDTEVEVDVNGIDVGVVVTITFDVAVIDPLDADEIEMGLSNQGSVSGNNFIVIGTDDPDIAGDDDPTLTPLADICEGVQPTDGCRVNGGLGPCLGTSGDDVIIGTGGADRILGKGGSDVIVGLGGRDLICCGGGADFCYGDDGRDRIDGGGGADFLEGARGNDVITGGRGNDTINGREGRDRLDGGPGNGDVIDGGLGSDVCTDPDTATFISCGPSCGLGFELALVLAPLWWLRRSRRSA